jgi:hypothetical protein
MKTLNELGDAVRGAQAASDSIEENIYAAEKARKEALEAADAAIASLKEDHASAKEAHQAAISALQEATDRVKAGDYGVAPVPEDPFAILEDVDEPFEGVNRTEAGDWAGI